MILNYSILAACQYNSTEQRPTMWDELAKATLSAFIDKADEDSDE